MPLHPTLHALVGLIIGVIFAWISIRRGRQAQKFNATTITWIEQPIPLWNVDSLHFTFNFIHSISLMCFAVLFLWDMLSFNRDSILNLVIGWVLTIVWALASSTLAFLFVYRYAGKITMFLFTDVVARGQYLADWTYFSHFRADPVTRIIRLYSKKTPQVVRAAWQPPTDELFSHVCEVLSMALPNERPLVPPPWYRRRFAVIGMLVVVITPFLLGAIIVAGGEWSWLYYTFAVFLVTAFAPAITRFYAID